MEKQIRPSGKLYGVTHDPSGEPRIIEPKAIKVGIGLLKGKAVHAYIDLAGQWVIQIGAGRETKRERFATKIEAQKRYRAAKETAPAREYPQGLPYFTFSHISADGDFEPDWDIIESHGPVPTEMDIIFMRDDPFISAFQFFSATEKKCEGDGKVALRINTMAATEQEKALAAEAEKRGEKYFLYTAGCRLAGLPVFKIQRG